MTPNDVPRHHPASLTDASELLRSARAARQKLGFVGGGTALGLGNPGSPVDAVVHTRGLDRVLDYAPEDQVIAAEAGVTLGALQSLAASRGQWLGVDAPDAEQATLGGLVAVGAYGPRRARYGAIRDLLLGVTLIRGDGVIAKSGSKVVKNVAGFDLQKVLCGSLGTLGLVASVILRLHPRPESSVTVLLSGLSAQAVSARVLELRGAQLEPSSVVALRAPTGGHELGVRFEGFRAGVERDVACCQALGQAAGAAMERPSEAEAARFWAAHDRVRSGTGLRLRVAGLPSHLPQVGALLEPLFSLLEAPRFAWYASLGVGFAGGVAVASAELLEALLAARRGMLELGGSLVVEAAPVELRAWLWGAGFDAWGPIPAAFAVMRELKQRFDPDALLQPGRFVGGI